jgi:hypothetical protein
MPRRRPRRGRLGGLLIIGVLTGGAVAALLPEDAPAAAVAEEPATATPPGVLEADYTTVSYDVADILAKQRALTASDSSGQVPEWVNEYERVLSSRTVTLNFPETPLVEVIAFLQDITGLNILIAPSVNTAQHSVSLRLREILLEDALTIILDQVGLARRFQSEALIIIPRDVRPQTLEPAEWPLTAKSALPPTPLDRLRDQIKYAVVVALGPTAWTSPASVSLRSKTLDVCQIAAGHAAIQEVLAPLRPRPLPRGLAEAWFAPNLDPVVPPGLAQAKDYARRIQSQRITLNFDGVPLDEAAGFISDITGIQCRLSPTASAEDATVSLRLKDISLKNAMNLIVASSSKLVWDVDRDGLLIRTVSTPSFEARLTKVAAEALSANTSADQAAIRERLQSQAISVSFTDTPLAEVVDFMRDITGLNYVIPAGVDTTQTVTCTFSDRTLSDALSTLLEPLDLGTSIEAGVILIVPSERANRRSSLAKRAQTLKAKPLGDQTLRGANLGALAETLKDATQAYVVLTENARRSGGRIAVAQGVTVGEALESCRGQIGLESAWGWISPDNTSGAARKLVLVLDVDPSPTARANTLQGAIELAAEVSHWTDAPDRATEELNARRSALTKSLDLLSHSPEAELTAQLSAVASARATLREILEAHHLLAVDAKRELIGQAEMIFWTFEKKDLELRRHSGFREDAKAKTAQIGALQDALLAASKRDEKWLERAPLRARLQEDLATAEQRSSRFSRDTALKIARLRSERAQLKGRLQHTILPGQVARLDEAVRELRSGTPWAQLFPNGFASWNQALSKTFQDRVRVGISGLSGLGLTLEPSDAGTPAVTGAATSTGLAVGDVILSVASEPTLTPLSVLEQVGKHTGKTVDVVYRRGDVEHSARVEIPVAPPND